MIARIHKQLEDKERGFTLIELLVVIIIIGILAAIAIPAFLNQRQNAWASQVESDLRNAAIAAESYSVTNGGSYADLSHGPATEEASLAANGYNATADVTVEVDDASVDSFTLTGAHANLDDTWTYNSDDGSITKD